MPRLKAHSHWYECLFGRSPRVLSIKQPWLHAIVQFGKLIENRSYSYRQLGARDGDWIALHASSSLSRQEYESATEYHPRWSWPAYSPKDRNEAFGLGCIHGFARLKRCLTESTDEWFCGPYGWEFDAVLCLTYPYGTIKGALGLWQLPVEARVTLLDHVRRGHYDVIRR